MKNLRLSGLELRTIQPKEYTKMVEDINANFLAILNSPGFKGAPGKSIVGPSGVGVRGSKWIFVAVSDFSDMGIENEGDLTLDFINTFFTHDPTGFTGHLRIPDNSSLIYGDMLVLPSGQVIILNQLDSGDAFEDTGISFAQVSQMTVEEVTRIVRTLIGPSNESEGVRFYNAIAKNSSDLSPALNINMTSDSIIDIEVVGAGPGVEVPNHIFLAPSDVKVLDNSSLCFITGSPQKYHELIQATQIYHTNDYGPGVDDWAAHVILQNSYNNGLLLGHKDSESFRDFSRIYKSASSLILTSSYSPDLNEYSYLELSDTSFSIKSDTTNILSNTLKFNGNIIESKHINQTSNELILGRNFQNSELRLISDNIFLTKLIDASFLTTDRDGKLIKKYTITDVINDTSTMFELVPASVLYTILNDIQDQIDNLDNRVFDLEENADTSMFYERLPYVKSNDPAQQRDLNTYTGFNFVRFEDVLTNFGFGDIHILNAPDFSDDYLTSEGDGTAKFMSSYIYSNISLSVKSVSQSGNSFIQQEFTCTRHNWTVNLETDINTGILRKWVRMGITNAGVTSWGPWQPITMGSTNITATGAIEFSSNTISHKRLSPSALLDYQAPTNPSNGYHPLRDINLDRYGHVTSRRYLDLLETGVGTQPGTIVWFAGSFNWVLSGYIEPNGQYIRAIENPLTYARLQNTWGPYKYEDLPPNSSIDIGTWNSHIDPRLMFRLPNYIAAMPASGINEDGSINRVSFGVRPWLKLG